VYRTGICTKTRTVNGVIQSLNFTHKSVLLMPITMHRVCRFMGNPVA